MNSKAKTPAPGSLKAAVFALGKQTDIGAALAHVRNNGFPQATRKIVSTYLAQNGVRADPAISAKRLKTMHKNKIKAAALPPVVVTNATGWTWLDTFSQLAPILTKLPFNDRMRCLKLLCQTFEVKP